MLKVLVPQLGVTS